jgi:Leucine-rich repeat (LRR) protein
MQRRNLHSKILSVLLTAVLVLTLFPATASAAAPEDVTANVSEAEEPGTGTGTDTGTGTASGPLAEPEEPGAITALGEQLTPLSTDITAAFTDPVFLAYVRAIISKTSGEPIYDTDLSEITDVNATSSFNTISSLAGIEYFTGLKTLYCYSNELTTLDLSANTELEYLSCDNNQLPTLDLSANTKLKTLSCSNNELTTLDLSANTELESLYCGHNKLTTLALSANTKLEYLDCSYNHIAAIGDVIVGGTPEINFAPQYAQLTGDPLIDAVAKFNTDHSDDGEFFIVKSGNVYTITGTMEMSYYGYNSFELVIPSGVTVKWDGKFTSNNSRILLLGEGTFEVIGGVIESGMPISAEGVTVVVSGGLVLANDGVAIFAQNDSDVIVQGGAVVSHGFGTTPSILVDEGTGTVTVSGGVVYAYREDPVSVSNPLSFSGPTDNGILIKQDSYTYYFEKDSTAELTITQAGEGATASWDKVDGVSGIRYAKGDNTGFFPVPWVAVQIDITDKFTDLNFLMAVRNAIGKPEGAIYDTDAAQVYYLTLSGDIINLEGIEYFTSLYEFICTGTQLTSLDLPQNIAEGLSTLDVQNNRLTTLDLSDYTALNTLKISGNQLATLDVSANPELEYLYCNDNRLTTLDLTANTKLYYLECDDNWLTALDLPETNTLNTLFCSGNELTTLDVSENPGLSYLFCGRNQLSSLDLSVNYMLYNLNCANNNIAALNLTANYNLSILYCNYNYIPSKANVTLYGAEPNIYEFDPQKPTGFISVTNIQNLQYYATVDVPLTLTGDVIPATANNNTIVWSISNDGGTGAKIENGVFSATSPGTVGVIATVENGLGDSNDYQKYYSILVTEQEETDPEADNADIAAAKTKIEAGTYATTQAATASAAAAKTIVENAIAALDGFTALGVTTVVSGTYTAPTAGTPGNLNGTNGSYTFTVSLTKGGGTPQSTQQRTLTITATVYVDEVAPVLTAGAVDRISDETATVKFTSDEAGEYYYAVVDSGAEKPNIDTSGVGVSCGTTEQTLTLSALSAGAKDLYIVVKDASDNVSAGTFKIVVPAYVAPVYSISLSETGMSNFEERTYDYSYPPNKLVSIENTGNRSTGPLTAVLSGASPSAFSIFDYDNGNSDLEGTLAIDSFSPGSYKDILLCPQSGLVAGTYTARVTVSGDNGITAYFDVRFTVKKTAQPAPTGIGKTNETTAGANDGTITGVTTDMEFKLSSATSYTSVTSATVSALAPGTYYVRYAAKPNYNAGDVVVIVISAGNSGGNGGGGGSGGGGGGGGGGTGGGGGPVVPITTDSAIDTTPGAIAGELETSEPQVTPDSIVATAKNVTAIRSPLKTLYLTKGKAFTPPVDFDGKDKNGKAWGYKGYGAAPKLTWTSSNSKVATVDSKTGKISPKQTGTVKITTKALNGKFYTFTVKVVSKAKKLTKLALKNPPTSLKVGRTAVLKLKLTSAKATNLKVTFKSSKPSVIKVDKAGKLFAVKKGTAKITVKAGGKKKVITVSVK